MGEVWKARDTRLDRIVTVKRLKGQHSAGSIKKLARLPRSTIPTSARSMTSDRTIW